MTSAPRTTDSASLGFSLLEIVVVLVLIAVLAGGAIGLMVASDDGRALKECSVEVEALAKRARTLAALQQRPYALEFAGNQVSLMPLAEAMIAPDERERAAGRSDAEDEGQGGGFNIVRADWSAASGIRLFVRRWASEDWIAVDSKNRQVWRFDPEGFCEPVGVRVQKDANWLEAEFHPLTASIRSTASEIY
ncbi:MAG: prepilin-type N-terminal cleavage/methylation domain-containing protein [Verrucomicrobia bacterium]|nr:MAG: prepilin-type N-terminal cleavage/methylation domain-containing protein [Verrucomicrobiota bacterium]TAE89156.1 MAG: prepilin-type N-terminal cleavage/methylation domain-containing protein [Verrucomicrobiota bacterium]TAF27970.1 MAG: prepilin-type N-terminal cleavage/methylation domain-containing protein [Verrucomicrobiota bacterium]TAF42818.1 MAG: prepilin-type N-terminal cleavage/methylation domain-containing protein [Verrucomicrobiota bacterium]